jgi:hypothetical protein
MRKPLFPALLAAAALFVGVPAVSMAQTQVPVSIKKIDAAFFESPQITAGSYRKTRQGQPTPWLEIDVTLDHGDANARGPKVADEITVNYYILLNNAAIDTVNADGKPTLLTGSVTHADVPYGRGLHTAVFVSPQTLFRYFDGKVPTTATQAIVDVGVSISDKTGVLAVESLKSKPSGGKTWWDDLAPYSQVTGRVMAKDQTPFAALAWDYHLPPKPKSGL